MLIAVREKNGARSTIRITLKTKAWKEEKIKIAGYRLSAEIVVFGSVGGPASALIRSYLKRPTFKNKNRWVIHLCWEARL